MVLLVELLAVAPGAGSASALEFEKVGRYRTPPLPSLRRRNEDLVAARASVVLLHRMGDPSGDSSPGNATGFIVQRPDSTGTDDPQHPTGSNIILTNAHPFRQGDKVLVGFSDGVTRFVTSEVRLPSDSNLVDLAVIELPPDLKAFPPLRLDPAPRLTVGQRLFTIGHPFGGLGVAVRTGLDPVVFEGPVMHMGGEFVFVQAASMPGESGAPVLDRGGRVVGMHNIGVGPMDQTPVYSGFVPVSEWLHLLPALVQGNLRTVATGIESFSATPLERAYALSNRVLTVPTSAVTVTGIAPNSPAARAGLAPNDVILTLGPQPGRPDGWVEATYAELKHALLHLQHEDESLLLRVLREGWKEPRTLELNFGRTPALETTASPPPERDEPPPPQQEQVVTPASMDMPEAAAGPAAAPSL
ncbi:MAG: trypsin-like peptidase domain-containing protein [Proteobacteria bacterium]|nr:trypsin-like peptidase domain-containing protein [Pseudomonadota bacterium]